LEIIKTEYRRKIMEEIKGMSEAAARTWLMKHGYGLSEIDGIIAGEDMCANPGAPAEKAAPVKVAPAPVAKATPKVAPKASATKAAPKASK
jgi:hypothetical protein